MAQEIYNKDLGALELASDELVPNCGASYGIPCSQPVYGVSFTARATATARDICAPVIEFQNELGLDAYMWDDTSKMVRVQHVNEVIDICVERLELNVGEEGGTPYFRDTVLYEDGSEDNLYKLTTIAKREDGSYYVEFSISRDQKRIGFYEID